MGHCDPLRCCRGFKFFRRFSVTVTEKTKKKLGEVRKESVVNTPLLRISKIRHKNLEEKGEQVKMTHFAVLVLIALSRVRYFHKQTLQLHIGHYQISQKKCSSIPYFVRNTFSLVFYQSTMIPYIFLIISYRGNFFSDELSLVN